MDRTKETTTEPHAIRHGSGEEPPQANQISPNEKAVEVFLRMLNEARRVKAGGGSLIVFGLCCMQFVGQCGMSVEQVLHYATRCWKEGPISATQPTPQPRPSPPSSRRMSRYFCVRAIGSRHGGKLASFILT